MKYDVFVSYRRSSFESANLIAEKLRTMGYSVFFDVETLRSGKFNEQLFKVIDECTDFIIVLPPDALDRCHNAEDWVRREVVYAMSKNKNIVPVMLSGFEWPNPMPADMEELCNYQSISAGEKEFFDLSMKRLAGYLKSKKHRDLRKFFKKFTATIVAICVLLGVGWMFVLKSAKTLCYDVGVCLTLEMGILNTLRIDQINYNELWQNYLGTISKPKISSKELAAETEMIQNILSVFEEDVKKLHDKVEKYSHFSSFQTFLLGIYDLAPQDISAFSAFYDALFDEALGNIAYMKMNATPPVRDISRFMVEKQFEGWEYSFKSLYYCYMATISEMPKNVQEYYYENAKFSAITNPIPLNKDQKEYEHLIAVEMAKYQGVAKDIQLAVEKHIAPLKEQLQQ